MPLPIISSVMRVTFNQVPASGHATHNVLHFTTSGNEAALAADIDTALGTLAADSHLFWCLPSAWKCTTIDILPLDGSSTTTPFILSNDQQGGASGAAIYQASGVVSHYTAQRGSRGRGRSFLGPVAEDAQANGVLDATGKGLMQTAWGAFRAAVAGAGSDLVVASYQHADANLVTSETVQGYIATQRRRAKFLQ